MSDAIDLVKRSYAAFAAGDRAAMETILAPDFRFTSPYDNGIDLDTYWQRCWPGAGQGGTFEFVHLASAPVPEGELVFVTYTMRGPDGSGGRNTEIATVRDGRIAAFEVYFGWNEPHDAPEGGWLQPYDGDDEEE